MTSITTRFRRTLIALLATVIASFGATAAIDSAVASSHHHSKRHHSKKHHHSGIPQGNVGDNDADNHGGPSDGDGNI